LLFLILEILSIGLITGNNSFHRAAFLNSSNIITSSVYNTWSNISRYFSLTRENNKLLQENIRLREQLDQYALVVSDSSAISTGDTVFNYIPARVINNSANKQHNYITLNKGRKDGVRPDQGIISGQGIVGIVTNVSESYSMGLSVLNPRWGISAKLKKSGYYGSLVWPGKDYNKAELKEIPFHINLEIGDTIVTSGYSSAFPEGVLIGTIEHLTQPEGENYYKIEVLLSTDFKSVSSVEIIDNKKVNELQELKNATENAESGN